jgi:hypothetical protein
VPTRYNGVMSKTRLRAVILGFGNVGQKMAAILAWDRNRYPGPAGLEPAPVAISTCGRGAKQACF